MTRVPIYILFVGLLMKAHHLYEVVFAAPPQKIDMQTEEPDSQQAPERSPPPHPEKFNLLHLTPEKYKILKTLHKQEDRFRKKEQELTDQKLFLSAIEKRFQEKFERLQPLKEKMAKYLHQVESEKDLINTKLHMLFTKLKPEKAAELMEGLDFDTLLNILKQMNDREMVEIISQFAPKKAKIIIRALAVRSQNLENAVRE